jgi:hypothetical protein
MLKFTAGSPDGPGMVGLGLSFENLRRIRQDAIQFFAEEVALPPGLFIIAHADDPKLPSYRAHVGTLVRELVILTENTCNAFQQRSLLVEFPLESSGKKALIFAGETEELLLDAFKKHSLVGAGTKVTGPDPEPTIDRTSEFRVDPFNLFKLGAGGVGFLVILVMLMLQRHHSEVDFLVWLIMIATAGVFFALLYLRFSERIEIDGDGIRRRRRSGAFDISWKDLSKIEQQEDALGPYRLHLTTHGGRVHKLERIYDDWDGLLKELQGRRP